jgi:hypothetical protein
MLKGIEYRDALIDLVMGLFINAYQRYSTMSYKGIADYDVYLFLVHVATWLLNANEFS